MLLLNLASGTGLWAASGFCARSSAGSQVARQTQDANSGGGGGGGIELFMSAAPQPLFHLAISVFASLPSNGRSIRSSAMCGATRGFALLCALGLVRPGSFTRIKVVLFPPVHCVFSWVVEAGCHFETNPRPCPCLIIRPRLQGAIRGARMPRICPSLPHSRRTTSASAACLLKLSDSGRDVTFEVCLEGRLSGLSVFRTGKPDSQV